MRLMRVRPASQLTLPADVCRALGIKPGDYLDATILDKGVLLRPVIVKERGEVESAKGKASRRNIADSSSKRRS